MRALARILRNWLSIAWVFLLLGAATTGPHRFVAADFNGDGQLNYADLSSDDISVADDWFSFSAACVVDDRTVDPPDDASQTAPAVCALTNSRLYPPALLATRLSVHDVVLPESSRVLASLGPRPPPFLL